MLILTGKCRQAEIPLHCGVISERVTEHPCEVCAPQLEVRQPLTGRVMHV